MKFDPETYTITIKKELIEEQWMFVGRVAEFPHLIAYEDSFESARAMLMNSLIGLKKVCDKQGKDFPKPKEAAHSEYNGRLTLRIPKTLHSKIARLAEEEDMSINSLLVSAISEYAGRCGIIRRMTRASAGTIRVYENWDDSRKTGITLTGHSSSHHQCSTSFMITPAGEELAIPKI